MAAVEQVLAAAAFPADLNYKIWVDFCVSRWLWRGVEN
jgi:hypothetical protein